MKQIKNQVRQAIIEAVPEITGPRKGSELVRIGFGEGDWAWIPSITLADVLLAMDNRRKENYTGMENINNQDYLLDIFDLEKDLDWQSDDVWRFLHSVLVKK
jgi:hypothetical protein